MSRADELYEKYSTTKRFSTQNVDERNKRYKRRSDELYDKYSTTRRFESSIQYADDEEEKKENKPVIQPDTSVKPQQQTNTQTQTQTQVQAPAQTQTQITAPSLLEMQSEFGGFAQNSNKPVKADPLTFNKYGKGIDAAVANFSTTPEQQRKNQKTLQNVQKSLTSNNELLNKNLQEKSDAYSQKVNEIVKSNKDDDVKNNLAYEEQLKYEIENLQIALNRQNRQAMGLNPDKIYSDEQIKSAEITQRLDNLGGDSRYSLNQSEEQKTANDTAALLAEKSAQLKAVQELNAPYHLMDNPELSKDLQTMYANRKDPKAIETYGKNIKAAGYDPQKMLDWYTTQKNEEILKNPTAVALLNEIYAYNTRSTSEYDDEYDDSYIEKVMKEKSGYKAPHIVAMEARGKLANMGYDVDELYSYYSAKLNREGTEALLSPVKQFAKEHPVLGAATSIALTPLTSFGGIGAVARSVASGTPVDPNDPSMIFANTKSTIDSTAVSNANAFDGLVYKTATTLGSMLVNKGISSAVGGGQIGYGLLSAVQAITSSVQEDSQKGYSVEHIATNALIVGAMNFAFSMIGFEKVFGKKTVLEKGLKKAFLKAGFSEVGEELAEDGINLAAKNITNYVFNHETEIKADAERYMSMGYGEDEAHAKVWSEIGLQLLETGAISFITGPASNVVSNSPKYLDGVARLVGRQINIDLDSTAGRDAFDKLDINIGNATTDTENEQKTPLNSSVVANDETVDTPKQNAVTGQNTSYANEFDNLYDEDVSEEFKQPAEEVDTTVGEDGAVYFDFDDDTDFEAVNEELKEEYNAEETAGLTEKVEPYTSGNTSVDALINPNGRLDRKITINEQAQQRITDIAQRFFGRKVKFVDDIPNANGVFDPDTGEFVLSKTSSMKELTLFGHEFAHTLEGTDEYRYLTTHLRYNSQYIKSQLAKVNNSWDELVQKKINDYQDSLGKTLTKPQAEFEIYADAIANELFTDYKSIEVLATQNQSLFTRLKQWFYRNVIKTSEQTTVLGTKAAQRKTYALMLKAEKAAMNKSSSEGVVTPTETVVFEPTQIKSATDNIGTFDKNNPDIRYSAKQSEAAQRITENFGYTETTANNIVKAARTLRQKADSKADLNELAYTIAQTLEDRRNGNTDGRDAERIAMMLAENAEAVNEDFVAEHKPILDRLNGMTISISEADISDLGDAFSYVKKRLFPYVTLTKGEGTRVDSIFQDLAKDYPMVFNAEAVTHPGDQVRAIMGFIEDYRNNRYFKPYFESDEAFANLREDVETLLGDKTLDENTYLNKLSQLVDKYGEIKNGVPQSTDGKTRVRGAIASFYGTKPIVSNPELSERYAKDIVNGKYDYTVMRIGKEAKQYLDNIKSSENVTEKVINEYGRLKDLLTNKNHRLTPTDIMQACALNPLLGEVLTDDAYVDYTSIVSEVATETGQMVSCFRILSEFSGAQKLKAYQKKLDQINAERSKNYQGAPDYNAVADENGQFKMADESLSEGKSPKNKTPKGFIELAVAKKGSKYPPIEIPIELQEELVKAKGKAEIDSATDKINKYLAQQVHPTWFDKFNAWRYFSMLSNPKTAIRNTVGNVAMGTTARIKDVVAATLSLLPSKYKNDAVQTVSVTTTKEARKAATRLLTESDNVFSFFSNQDKYTGRTNEFEKGEVKLNKLEKKIAEKNPLLDTIFHKREIHPSAMASTGRNVIDKPLGKLSDIQQKALDDTLFKVLRAKSVVAQSITQAVKKGDIENLDDFLAVALNGNTEHIDNATKTHYQQLFDTISRQAAKEGDEATFRDDNEFANALNKFAKGNSKTKRALSIAVEALVPFKKTPANIVKRGYEYSPAGLIINTIGGRVQLAKGEIDRNTYINNIAKGLTGTGIFALGTLLSSLGVLNVGDDDEEDKAERKLLGGQNYSVNVGDGTYTIDFLSPAALPLFMGGKVYETVVSVLNGDEIKATEFMLDVMKGVAEPMFAQTMLDGIDGAFEAISRDSAYDDTAGASFMALVNYCAENWAQQFVPSFLGGIARTADDTVRSYYNEPGKDEGLLDNLMVGIKKKLPGKTDETPAKLDMWGQPISSGSLGERLIENFISPGYYEKNTEDEATLALHEFADDNDIPYTEILPKEVPKYFTAPNGDRINLTAEEYEIYAGIIGKARKEAVEKYLIDGDNAEIKYTCKVIKPKNKSGTGEEDYVFKGNINEAKNTKSWGKVVKNNDGTPTKIDVSSDEDFRAMLYKKLMEQVTEDAKAEVEQKILKKRK